LKLLLLGNSVAVVSYSVDGVKYKREYLASVNPNVIAFRISSDENNSISFSLKFETELKMISKEIKGNVLLIKGICPSIGCAENIYEKPISYEEVNGKTGMKFACGIKVVTNDGNIEMSENGISVFNASKAEVYITSRTNFCDKTISLRNGDEYEKECIKELDECTNFESIKLFHIKKYTELYDRVKLDLNSEKSKKTTDERIRGYVNDRGLIELMFNFGRYLMISGSQEGSQAMTLQGIWNEELIAPWSSNYTLNINTEMNYWPTFICNLAECFEPFVRLVEKISKTGEQTAICYYGAGGFVCHHNSDIWGYSSPVGIKQRKSCNYSFWNMSSGWLSCQLFDLYEYTMDKECLRARIYPILKKATEFYLDIMIENQKGKLMVSPSTSPENWFADDSNGRLCISETTTMTISILSELFEKTIKACEILECFDEFYEKVKNAEKRLMDIEINNDGRVKEWYGNRQFKEFEVKHRHLSHLYALYPGNKISINKTAELAEASCRSLNMRGDDGTGWSIAWKTNLWAKLREGNRALETIHKQIRFCEPETPLTTENKGGTYPNLFDAHPPFQIDGNFGLTAGIANMLMQSEMNEIDLLPALPDEWQQGYVKGLVAKGNITVDIKWKECKVKEVKLVTAFDQKVKLILNGKKIIIDLKCGIPYILKP